VTKKKPPKKKTSAGGTKAGPGKSVGKKASKGKTNSAGFNGILAEAAALAAAQREAREASRPSKKARTA